MASFPLLDQAEEDKLHRSRLLAIEEKPFKRITKRLLTPSSLLSLQAQLPPTPPPDANGEEATQEADAAQQKLLEERRQFRDDLLLDFAAFDSSIARLQFLQKSNSLERERYASQKSLILQKSDEVRSSTAELRLQLEEAKKTMEQRKKFDELAEKILNSKMLRSREEQEASLRKLEEECREVEGQIASYSETWKERREQFGRILEECMQLRRLIRDEKEEVERREGMDEHGEGGEEDGEVGEGETGSKDGVTPKRSSERSQSRGTTPKPDGNATPRPDGEFTPRPGSQDGGATPGQSDSLKPHHPDVENLSRPDSRVGSRASSRASTKRRREEVEEGEDSTMEDSNARPSQVDTPMADCGEAATPAAELVDVPAVEIKEASEDGIIDESGQEAEQMDTT
jgi:hypothetical protein